VSQKRSTGSRPVIDTVVLVAILLCFGIALVRLAAVVATVPYAVYHTIRASAGPDSTAAPARKSALMRVRQSATFKSWWGGRTVPYRAGDDYYAVISHHIPTRTIGIVIGLVAEEDRAKGIAFDKVLVPVNRTLLYGEAPGKLVVSATGEATRTGWGSFAHDAGFISNVDVVEQEYNPVLTAEQNKALTAQAGLVQRSRAFYVGTPKPGQSGTWIMLARVTPSRREFLLVPIEYSPVGGAR